jgi:hypothetical protein
MRHSKMAYCWHTPDHQATTNVKGNLRFMAASIVGLVSLLNKRLPIYKQTISTMTNLKSKSTPGAQRLPGICCTNGWCSFFLDQSSLWSTKTTQSAKNQHTGLWAFQEPGEPQTSEKENNYWPLATNLRIPPIPERTKYKPFRWVSYFQSWGLCTVQLSLWASDCTPPVYQAFSLINWVKSPALPGAGGAPYSQLSL